MIGLLLSTLLLAQAANAQETGAREWTPKTDPAGVDLPSDPKSLAVVCAALTQDGLQRVLDAKGDDPNGLAQELNLSSAYWVRWASHLTGTPASELNAGMVAGLVAKFHEMPADAAYSARVGYCHDNTPPAIDP
ncbi:MAG: hypothetical protein QM719_01540 [Thermomonas sp.]